jgi:hypothetical protein
MNATPELVAAIQRERDARIREDHLAAIASCAKHCCSTSLASRLSRIVHGTPAAC